MKEVNQTVIRSRVGTQSARYWHGDELIDGLRTRTIPMNTILFKELMTLKQDAGPEDFVFS